MIASIIKESMLAVPSRATDRVNSCYRLAAIASRAWGSTRIGPQSDPFPAVRRRFPAADKTPSAGSSYVRRRHADLLLL